jgi:sporulation protein YlmC with PRC-barrel domain
MLRNLTALYDYKLAASDGDIGRVKDFYFDDKTWVIRYLVADTGSWLAGRLVLLTPHVFGRFNEGAEKVMLINLTRQRIEKSPSIESHKPVSRQYEVEYYRYYGWPAYWNGGAMWGLGGYPVVSPPLRDELEAHHQYHHRDDKHLRSAHSVTGYHIQTVDGTIGHVSGLIVDDRSWAIHKLVVETGHWYSGKEILITPNKIERISYEDSKVFVTLTKEDIQRTSENEVARTGVGGG